MIIDNALSLRELKAAVDAAIERHGDHLPVEIRFRQTVGDETFHGEEWATEARPRVVGGFAATTRFVLDHS